MAIVSCIASLKLHPSEIFGASVKTPNVVHIVHPSTVTRPLVVAKRHNTRTESAKVRNLRFRKKFNGTATKPRLSVFGSGKHLYAMLVDDHNKKCLFYGSTLQKSMRNDQSCTSAEAAERVGEELVKACVELDINEISCYDRNGWAIGERTKAFEIAIARHGFLSR